MMIDAAKQVKELQDTAAENMYPDDNRGERTEVVSPDQRSEKEEANKEPKVEQPKRTDFPLDHILPVFNINRHDQNNNQKQFPGAWKKN